MEPLILAPEEAKEWPAWRERLVAWKNGLKLDRSAYDQPEFAWVRSCFVCGMAMLFDREFYDEAEGRFDVTGYLARMRRDFGGLDGLVLWQAYPRIGVDDRNQFDHYRLAPGLREAIEALRREGIRVFMAYNPWDVGTRREGVSDIEALTSLVREFGFDGVFLDTLEQGPETLRRALDHERPGVTMESERALPVEGIPLHHVSWAQWFDDSEAPGVLRNRWVEPRHQMHLTRRWDLDHSGELQLAWMNGAGILVWENVFGSWNGWNDRDKATLRAISPIWRRYADLFTRGEWHPLEPLTLAGAYATRWSRGGLTLWTVVNRTKEVLKGAPLPVSNDGAHRLFDLIHGLELDHFELELPPRGFGAVASLPASRIDDAFLTFLKSQAAEYVRSKDALRTRIEPRIVRRAVVPAHGVGEPSFPAGSRTMQSRFRMRECGEYEGARLDNAAYPRLHFERRFEERVSLGRVAVDAHEVTRGEYERFVRESGYRPRFAEGFLEYGSKAAAGPVVGIDLDDARAYARWAGKRLPTEYEWQAANPGPSGLWNWTESQHFDGHTRFSILKGGGPHIAGSEWYVDGGPLTADWSTKLIHFYPELDRSPVVSFRCAVDLDP